jgi:hypothetical protein
MKRIILSFILLFACGGWGYSALPPLFEENFNSGDWPLPGWTQINVAGDNWRLSESNAGCSPYSFGAVIPSTSEVLSHGALITPAITIPNSPNSYILEFSVRGLWGTDEADSRKVMISEDGAGDLANFKDLYAVPSTGGNCAPITGISLDDYKGTTVHLAFVFEGSSGNDWLVDDIIIKVIKDGPAFGGNSAIDMGDVYNNVNIKAEKFYRISNEGSGQLNITDFSGTAGISTTTTLPLSIPAGESKNLNVVMDAFTAGLPLGNHKGSFTLETSDFDNASITVDVTARITQPSGFIYETFNDPSTLVNGLPANWERINNWYDVIPSQGVDGTPCANFSLYGDPEFNPTASYGEIKTFWITMGSAPVISYYLRALNVSSDSWRPARRQEVEYRILVSQDNVNWDTVFRVERNQHVASDTFRLIEVPATALQPYLNKACRVRFTFGTRGDNQGPDIEFYIDNITLGTIVDNDLEAASISGNGFPIAGKEYPYTVQVNNSGTLTQSNYTVKLMQEGNNTPLASATGVEIAKNEVKSINVMWTPDASLVDSTISLYGVVEFEDDEMAMNNQTFNRIDVRTLSANIGDIVTGTGNELVNAPFDYGYVFGLAQSVYYPQEIAANGGQIKSLAYKSQFGSERTSKVKIWLTEIDSTVGYTEYEPHFITSSLKQVFDGEVTFSAGDQDVFIELDEAYNYKGGTLVVHTWRNEADNGINGRFRATSTQDFRTIRKYPILGRIDPISEANNNLNYSFAYVPNATFFIDLENIGSVTGIVNDQESNPIEDVTLRHLGGQFTRSTDIGGEYDFPYLTAGNYKIEISKFGYYTDTVDVTITDGGITTKNHTLRRLPGVTISGKITGSDTDGKGLAGVTVTLNGYKIYTDTTDADGNYLIEDIYGDHTYLLTSELEGYVTKIDTLHIGTSTLTKDIYMYEIPYPVNRAMLQITDDKAIVKWNSPMPETVFRYDAGVFTGNNGLDSRYGVMGSVYRVEAQLTSMSWYIYETVPGAAPRQVNIFVFDLDEFGQPTNNILFSRDDVPTNINNWTTFEFPNIVEAPKGFFVAISRTQGHMHLGTSNPTEEYPFIPATQYWGAYDRNEFHTAESSNINKHFGVRASGIALGEVASVPAAKASTPINYIVYRLEEGDEESDWTMLDSNITSFTYTDNNWSTLAENGVYQYAIKTEYVNENISKPVFTNTITKGWDFDYTVNVTTNAGDAAIGAIITLSNQDGNSDHVYQKTVGTSESYFPVVWKGVYNISITKPGFNPYSIIDTIDQAGLSLDAELIESLIAPYALNVEVDAQDASALLSWNNAPEAFSDNIENYENFAITNIGDYTLIDLDGKASLSWDQTNFRNEAYVGSFIVMNPTATTPPVSGMNAHSGSKYLACFSVGRDIAANNDWLILPRIKIVEGAKLEFWARALATDVTGDGIADGEERFKVWASTAGTNAPADFVQISQGNYISVTGTEWVKYSFDLSGYTDENVYLAINCVTDYMFALFIDDIFVGVPEVSSEAMVALNASAASKAASEAASKAASEGTSAKSLNTYTVYLDSMEVKTGVTATEYELTNLVAGSSYTAGVQAVYSSGASAVTSIEFTVTETGIDINNKEMFTVYPNPVKNELRIQTEQAIKEITIVDMQGKVVQRFTGNSGSGSNGSGKVVNLQSIPSGHYIVKIYTKTSIVPVKIVKQ